MDEEKDENYPQPPTEKTSFNKPESPTVQISGPDRNTFPYPDDSVRMSNYEYFESLFKGLHFTAFNIKIDSEKYGKDYAKLKYIVANFPRLISQIIADLLFIEPPKIKVKDGDQNFVDALISENHLRTVNYENALANSYLGDNLYKLRIGKRNPTDGKATVIIEEVTPKIYFPLLNPANVKGAPIEQELAWKFKVGDQEYVRKEIHTAGKIKNEVWKLEGDKMDSKEPFNTFFPTIKEVEDTKIKRSTLIHVPNYRAGGHFGISDYYDLDTLFYAMNNRLTKVDNVLDTHSDPILALPDGILDEKGRVKKDRIGMFERPDGADTSNDPAYITWDANLESAFKEIDKLIEITLMISEISPAIIGQDKNGQAESGRALKFKLLRTMAKAQRKQLYYYEGLREVIYVAQLLAKAWDVEVDGKKLKGEAVKPDIVFADGLPADLTEMIENEAKRIDAGLTTTVDSLQRLDDIDEASAKAKAKEIEEENKVELPEMEITPDIPIKPPVKKAESKTQKPQE